MTRPLPCFFIALLIVSCGVQPDSSSRLTGIYSQEGTKVTIPAQSGVEVDGAEIPSIDSDEPVRFLVSRAMENGQYCFYTKTLSDSSEIERYLEWSHAKLVEKKRLTEKKDELLKVIEQEEAERDQASSRKGLKERVLRALKFWQGETESADDEPEDRPATAAELALVLVQQKIGKLNAEPWNFHGHLEQINARTIREKALIKVTQRYAATYPESTTEIAEMLEGPDRVAGWALYLATINEVFSFKLHESSYYKSVRGKAYLSLVSAYLAIKATKAASFWLADEQIDFHSEVEDFGKNQFVLEPIPVSNEVFVSMQEFMELYESENSLPCPTDPQFSAVLAE